MSTNLFYPISVIFHVLFHIQSFSIIIAKSATVTLFNFPAQHTGSIIVSNEWNSKFELIYNNYTIQQIFQYLFSYELQNI